MFPPHTLHCALSDSVASGVFIDTKFYLFSRRNSSGKICQPRPLYANSLTLKSVPFFEDRVTKSLDHDPFEDSDHHAEDCDYLSDSDLEDDVEVAEPVTKKNLPEKENRHSSVGEGFYNELNNKGNVVVLRGISFLTFQAIVMYLYTGEICFAPFGSKANRVLRTPELLSKAEDTIPRPSPKSVYRIADMYDIPKLKELALMAIRNGVKSCDAIEETFSKFTSRYSELVDIHAKNLASELLSSKSQDIQEQLNQKLRSFANGEIPYAANAISALFGVLARCRASDAPLEVNKMNLQPETKRTWAEAGNRDVPPHRKSMNITLIKSMHCGSFLDMEYRLRKRRIGTDQFASIYLSSIICDGIRSELDALTHAPNYVVEEEEQEEEDNRNHEEEPTPGSTGVGIDGLAQDRVPCYKFLPGALTTWKSLFLYLSFNEITFGPLRSQAASFKNSAARRDAGGALSCSPKSVYCLAKSLGLEPLADLACLDIIGKLTSENIVAELFSTITAHNDKLLEKQCLLLTSTLKTPVTTAMVQQYIQKMASGILPHCYDALRLAFGNTVDAAKHERQIRDQKIADERNELASRPRLRCHNGSSGGYGRESIWTIRNAGCKEEISIDNQKGGSRGRLCGSCCGSLKCSACHLVWKGDNACHGCKKAFR